jgi:organic radical activating enzyme
MDSLKVFRIFYSIQGEGFWTGTPCIFIRFSGCNLDCDWCDTKHADPHSVLSVKEIMESFYRFPEHIKRVVLTGGEPTIQKLGWLISMLKMKGYYIALETNGYRAIADRFDPKLFDWITMSPKEIWHQKECDELKVVFRGQDLSIYNGIQYRHRYLQPLDKDGKMNIHETLKAIEENPGWNLSVQVHKFIGVE